MECAWVGSLKDLESLGDLGRGQKFDASTLCHNMDGAKVGSLTSLENLGDYESTQ